MEELIQMADQQIGGCLVQTVNARDLHVFLEVGKVFGTWINDRIQQYGFVENQDFVCFPILGSKNLDGRGGHNRKDYHLTLDMAKELAMVERNDKGRQARRYFIECERRLRVGPPVVVEALEALQQRIRRLESDMGMLQQSVGDAAASIGLVMKHLETARTPEEVNAARRTLAVVHGHVEVFSDGYGGAPLTAPLPAAWRTEPVAPAITEQIALPAISQPASEPPALSVRDKVAQFVGAWAGGQIEGHGAVLPHCCAHKPDLLNAFSLWSNTRYPAARQQAAHAHAIAHAFSEWGAFVSQPRAVSGSFGVLADGQVQVFVPPGQGAAPDGTPLHDWFVREMTRFQTAAARVFGVQVDALA